MNNQLFCEKNIFSGEMYIQGLYIATKNEKDAFIKRDDPERCNKSSAVIPLCRGKAYVIRFENKPSALRAVPCKKKVQKLFVGSKRADNIIADFDYSIKAIIKHLSLN